MWNTCENLKENVSDEDSQNFIKSETQVCLKFLTTNTYLFIFFFHLYERQSMDLRKSYII